MQSLNSVTIQVTVALRMAPKITHHWLHRDRVMTGTGWAWTAIFIVLASWATSTVYDDLAGRQQAIAAKAEERRKEALQAPCIMSRLTEAEKRSIAFVVRHEFDTAETDLIWAPLERAGNICHVDRDRVRRRATWPTMFEELAAADSVYRSMLQEPADDRGHSLH